MLHLVIIEGDWNDGDYVTKINELNEEDYQKFLKAKEALKKLYIDDDLHWAIECAIENADEADEDCEAAFTQEELELLEWVKELFPYGYEGEGIHDYNIMHYEVIKKN